MLNWIIRNALRQRILVVGIAMFLVVYGAAQIPQLSIDVFPDLNRPRVTVMTEAHGMATEEVETLITRPMEWHLNGATGVQAVRSTSTTGMSAINVEFEWGTDIYQARQIVKEKIDLVAAQFPEEVKPQLAPVSSIMGQIMIAGLWSVQSEETWLFKISEDLEDKFELRALRDQELDYNERTKTEKSAQVQSDLTFLDLLREELQESEALAKDVPLMDGNLRVWRDMSYPRWFVNFPESDLWYAVVVVEEGMDVHKMTSPMKMRTLADWQIRPQLLAIPGVAQVYVMGGGRKQYQVQVDPELLVKRNVTLEDVTSVLQESNKNVSGGYLVKQGDQEYLVRGIGRIRELREVKQLVVKAGKTSQDRAILLEDVATIEARPQVKRGDVTVHVRGEDNEFQGGAAVVFTITKQPGADTKRVTEQVQKELKRIAKSLKDDHKLVGDIRLHSELYRQSGFIDRAIENVEKALFDGTVLVVIILFLFLLNFRTTLITLTAIPISVIVTVLIFRWFDFSINTMTLGGLAVAIGELVDDAIVDVENIFRRLRENRHKEKPLHPLLVVFRASTEIRSSIVFGTMIVVVVFMPLFALTGMEGRLFPPLAVTYIVSILASLFVSLTVTPVLSYWLLKDAPIMKSEREGFLVRWLKSAAGRVIRFSLQVPSAVLIVSLLLVVIGFFALLGMDRNFLPSFDEGSFQANVVMPPGTSLERSKKLAAIVNDRLKEIPDIRIIIAKTGRAEMDEHAMGVHISELILEINPNSEYSRQEMQELIRKKLKEVPGVVTSVEQPLAHLISHMISGVKAQVGIKIYGDDLEKLRSTAQKIKAEIESIDGVKDAMVEQQIPIPQLRIEVDEGKLARYHLSPGQVTEMIETALQGHVVTKVIEGQREFDLLVRFAEDDRENLEKLRSLRLRPRKEARHEERIPLGAVTKIYYDTGPNEIKREDARRRIIVQCNTSGRGMVNVVADIQKRIEPIRNQLGSGYKIEMAGQFESEKSAREAIMIWFSVAALVVFVLLYVMFKSSNFALQVMAALPMAFIGAVAALKLTGQTLSIASMVGFISLCGIASRNGILLINHYIHLAKYEGVPWGKELIIRAGQERLAPVLMTALTSGIGLLPLAMAAGEPGKEILYPVATVIVGGLISSTLLEFLVRPALFWKFGFSTGKRLTEQTSEEIELEEEDVPSATA